MPKVVADIITDVTQNIQYSMFNVQIGANLPLFFWVVLILFPIIAINSSVS